MDELEQQKQTLRFQFRNRSISQEVSNQFSLLLGKELTNNASGSLFYGVSRLAAYYPVKGEPNILPFLQIWLRTGKELFLPCYDEFSEQYFLAQIGGLDNQWLVPGKYGIPEPGENCPKFSPPFQEIPDIWLVPGIAFDKQGARLGRGGGWYDRLLQHSPAPKIGICPQNRVADQIPIEKHDIRMNALFTERGLCSLPS